jgi:deoxyribonuclease-4
MRNSSPIRFGLKIWSRDTDLLEPAADLIHQGIFHYLELTPIPGTDIRPYLDYRIPYIVHMPGEQFGMNIADPDQGMQSREMIGTALEWAGQLNAEFAILHPGYGHPDDAREFLRTLSDPRILIENMPGTGLSEEAMVGASVEEVKYLMGGNFGFCLDLNHAIKAAISLKRDYRALIREFLSLKPSVFHIADGMLTNERDEHLPIGEGEYDIAYLKRCIEEYGGALVTLETPRPHGSLKDDLGNRERFLLA